MYKAYFLITFFSFFLVKGALSRTYTEYYNAIYSKEISVLSLEDLKIKLVENGLHDPKAVKQVMHMNGIDEAVLKNLNSPKKIFIPVSISETKKEVLPKDQNKPICILLSPSALEKKNQTKLNYRTYHDYLYSRAVPNPQRLPIQNLLTQDTFSYPNLKRWKKITRWINKEKHAPGDFFYLPPCQKNLKEYPAKEPAKQSTVKVMRIKVEKKSTLNKPRMSYFATALMGRAVVEANDEIDSHFDLLFLKTGAGINYHLTDYTLRAGVAINSYLNIKFESNSGSGESNEINFYLDYLIGINKGFGKHSLTFQYDNLNYLATKSNETEVNLEPTRLHRISLMDGFSLTRKISLLGSIGFFPGISSDTSGYEYGLGLAYHFNKAYSLNTNFIQNKFSMEEIDNTSKVIVLGGSHRF